MEEAKQMLQNLNGGCSCFSWDTIDKLHLWGRNFDFNHIAKGSKVTFLPRGKEYYGFGTSLEHNLKEDSRFKTTYAVLGMGSLLIPSTPVIYEGINEKGLMGGQLYFRNFSHLSDTLCKTKEDVQPPFVVTYLLSTCASVQEVVDAIRNTIKIVGAPMLGTIPTVHWAFSDRTGEMIILEPDKEEITVYRNTLGVMTNSPSYQWHKLNLLNYFGIQDLDIDTLRINGEEFKQCFSGNGAFGLPGDCSSPSRFVRLSFLKKYGVKGRNEEEGVVNAFQLFHNVAFPLGLVKVSQPGEASEYDTGVVPYDYTVYTSVMCSESLKFYWMTYQNPRIQCVDMRKLLEKDEPVQFALELEPDIQYVN